MTVLVNKINPDLYAYLDLIPDISIVLYLLVGFLYIEQRIKAGCSPLSPFVIGYLLLMIDELLRQSIVPEYRYLASIDDTIGLFLIYLGLKDLQIKSAYISIKQKLIFYTMILFLILYLSALLYFSYITGTDISEKQKYFFLAAFSVIIIIEYFLIRNIVNKLDKIINVLKSYKPGKRFERIIVKSNDEIRILADIFNRNAVTVWCSNYRLKKNQEKLQKKILRENLTNEIITAIRSSLDIDQVLTSICDEVARIFNVQRASIVEFYDKTNFMNYTVKREYKASPDIKGLNDIKYDKRAAAHWGEKLLNGCNKIIVDNIQEADLPDYFKKTYEDLGVKSIMGFPIKQGNDKWGTLVVTEYNYARHWTKDEIELLESIANQLFVAIKQAELFTKTKNQKDIQNAILNNLPFTAWLKDKNGVLLAANEKYAKYLNSTVENVVGKTEFDLFPKELAEKYAREDQEVIEKRQTIYTRGIVTEPEGDRLHESYKSPIFDEQGNIIGTAGVSIDITERENTQLELIRRQEQILEANKREKLINNITNTIRSTLNISEIKNKLINELIQVFNPDRAFIYDMFFEDVKDYLPMTDATEYVSSDDIPKYSEEDVSKYKGAGRLVDWYVTNKNLIFNDRDEFIRENNLGADTEYFLEHFKVKSSLVVAIIFNSKITGVLGVQYNSKRDFKEEDIQFLKTIANQVGIAMNQAKLFKKNEQLAQREHLLRQIGISISSTFDTHIINKEIVSSIGRTLNADRCFIVEFNQEKNIFLDINEYSEYLSSPEVRSTTDFIAESASNKYFLEQLKGRNVVLVPDVDKFIEENNLQNSLEEEYLREYNILSGYAYPILYLDNLLGVLVLHYTHKKVELSQEELDFIKDLTYQTGIAIYQAKLYDTVKQFAEKESILREIVSEIKLSQNLEDVYTYVLAKLVDIFNVSRGIFIETSDVSVKEMKIKYEYIRNKAISSLKNIEIPSICTNNLLQIVKTHTPYIIEDVFEAYKYSNEAIEFFKKYSIGSIAIIPLIRYNHETRILGFFGICASTTKKWREKDIELLKSITDSVVTVVWEISKIAEINKLRESIIATLAHDLQVPLVGEHIALEFLLSRPEESKISNHFDLINEIRKNNEDLTNMLKRLVESYYYESGKKELKKVPDNLNNLILKVVDTLSDRAKSKNIDISLELDEKLPYIFFDAKEIEKVVYNLLDNSITYTQEGGAITVRSCIAGDHVSVYVKDNGPGIPETIKKRIFQRYETTVTIERKIGTGLGLYLSYLIIKAHDGNIQVESKVNEGTTFYFTLPIKNS